MSGKLFIVGTPIGNLGDMTLRAIETLKSVDVIYCEDTRRTLKLLNHLEIKKPLKSCPYFKEKSQIAPLLQHLRVGETVAYCTDAGMPGLSDPGALLVAGVRDAGFQMEVIGGVSSLTHFIAGAGVEFETFRFIGFLPPRIKDRRDVLTGITEPTIFFESPHRIESTLDLLIVDFAEKKLVLGKELSKISEAFYAGRPQTVKESIRSFKGEWLGCLWP